MDEIPSEHDSKLSLRHLTGKYLQVPSGSALLNITLCAERQQWKVRWIVTVRNAGNGVGVGVALRGAVNLDGADVLHREIVARIKRDVSLGDLCGETHVETEIERQLRQACCDERVDVVGHHRCFARGDGLEEITLWQQTEALFPRVVTRRKVGVNCVLFRQQRRGHGK